MPERNFRGDQSTLVIDGEAIPVTDKGWSYEREVSDSQFDDSPTPDLGRTNEQPTGDFEFDGRKESLEKRVVNADDDKFRITYRFADGGGFRFKGCILTDISASEPGDDKRNVSVSWEGEEAVPF
jgi:hypothetical protein